MTFAKGQSPGPSPQRGNLTCLPVTAPLAAPASGGWGLAPPPGPRAKGQALWTPYPLRWLLAPHLSDTGKESGSCSEQDHQHDARQLGVAPLRSPHAVTVLADTAKARAVIWPACRSADLGYSRRARDITNRATSVA